MHYRGLLRVARREGGVRLYAAREPHAAGQPTRPRRWTRWSTWSWPSTRRCPRASLSELVSHLRCGAPQWRDGRARRAGAREAAAAVGTRSTASTGTGPRARTRRRAATRRPTRCACSRPSTPWSGTAAASSCFWGWAYRFEAYTPAPKRVRGYYALPLLWRDQVIGWGNLALAPTARLMADLGYVDRQAAARARRSALRSTSRAGDRMRAASCGAGLSLTRRRRPAVADQRPSSPPPAAAGRGQQRTQRQRRRAEHEAALPGRRGRRRPSRPRSGRRSARRRRRS